MLYGNGTGNGVTWEKWHGGDRSLGVVREETPKKHQLAYSSSALKTGRFHQGFPAEFFDTRSMCVRCEVMDQKLRFRG